MAKPTYTPGAGFPQRLQQLLVTRNLRPVDLEKANVMSGDTLGKWQRGVCLPEKTTFMKFARHLRLNAEQARTLLRAEPRERDLVPPSQSRLRLERTLQTLTEIPALLAVLTEAETEHLHGKILAAGRETRERLRECKETASITMSRRGESAPTPLTPTPDSSPEA